MQDIEVKIEQSKTNPAAFLLTCFLST
uniref:Uncharacterized protein n=1 Tax=Rhizophora mucronata TaxID=61149 RepID=A0A2P2NAR4_RHIMU